MSKIRVHELAKEIGRQNKEVIEFLKQQGVDIKSHMSAVDETSAELVKNKFLYRGKGQIAKVDTPKTEEKVMTAQTENSAEAPKKKKNIIRVYHADNASDGGKKNNNNKPKRQATDKKPVAKTQAAPTQKPAEVKPAETKAVETKTAETKPVETKPVETKSPEVKTVQTDAGKMEGQSQARPQNRQPRENGNRDFRDGNRGGERRNNDRGPQNRQPRQGDGNRPARNGEGGQRPQRPQGQGRGEGRFNGQNREGGFGGRDNRGEGRFNGQNREGFGGRGENRGEGRFGGQGRGEGRDRNEGREGFGGRDNRSEGGQNRGGQNRGGQRQGTRRNDADAVFAPELTKTSKDSKRERDRENKNKKKDYEQQGNGHKPNQAGRKQEMSRIPKALQKPNPQPKHEEKKPEVKEIVIPEKLTIRELADAMKMQPSAIVKSLFMKGIMVTVNQEIDFEKAQEIAMEFDIIAEMEEKVDVIEELLKEEEEDEATMISRPPVVCVMGHVDHGKTSLLDAIRNTSVTRGEAGGITQHIGAYVVDINGEKITFLDTPGHEAFTAMRMRGANATDIAVLVVAADDGVMPQTVEAISHAKAAGVEIIVAINKIDKPSANIERVKQELSEYELIPEDWGGSTVFVPVSAHTGEGIESLLEMILLTAEVMELKANPKRATRGLVIEAQLDKGKGPVATILVQKGTLHVGDFIAAGACNGKVRAMMDDKGRRVKEAGPSTPVEILGLGDVPNAGEVLMSFPNDKEAKSFAAAFVSENKNRLLEETKGKLSLDNLFDQIQASDLKELPLIIKADVQGSVEAVKQSLVKLSNEEVIVKVIHGGVGAINESDVSLAATSNAIIIGFNVRPDIMAKQLAEQEGVDLRLYRVIYQAIEDVEAAMKGMLDPVFEEKVIGHAQVRQLFKASGVGTIAGSYVTDGIFQRNCKVRITREGEQIFEGELASLKRFKDDVKEVKTGYECGLVFNGFNDVKEDDIVEAYIMVEVPR